MNVRHGIATVVVVTVCGAGVVVVARLQQPKTQEGRKVAQPCTLKIDGMACGACSSRVEKVAKKIDGVRAVTVSHEKGTAQVTYDPSKTNPAAIAKAITKNSGFTSEAKQ